MLDSPEDALRPTRCALVVIDMQNDYLHDDGALARTGVDVAALRPVVPPLRRAIDLARAAGVPCVFVRQTHAPWTDTPAWRRRGRGGERLDVTRVPIVAHGSWGAEFYGVAPGDDDLVVTKHRYSAFAYTDLEPILAALGRDTALYTGVTTDVCVRYTAVDGLMRGVHPVLVSDATATRSAELQRHVEDEFRDHVGIVARVDDLAAAWAPVTTAGPTTR